MIFAKTKSDSIPRHFAITNFDEIPVRELLAQRHQITEEISSTHTTMSNLQTEVEGLEKTANLSDRQQLENLAFKKMQLSLFPARLQELENRLAQSEGELSSITNAGKYGLATAVAKLVGAESRRIEGELVKRLLPILSDETEAVEVARKSKRYLAFQGRHNGWQYIDDKAKALATALEIFDRYNATGSLETVE